MNKFIAVIGLIFLGFTVSAQTQATTFMFNGKLISSPTSSTDCGSADIAGVYEFEVSMLSDNNYTGQNIAIIVKCPAQYGVDFFKVGSNYKMELFDNNGGTAYSIVNPSVLSNYTLPNNYWAGDIVRR